MNTIQLPVRSPSFFMASVYSFLVHFIVLMLLLSIPIRSGGASSELSGGYSVFLSTEEPAANVGRLRGATVNKTGNATRLTGHNIIPVEDRAKGDAPQTDKEEAPVTDQGGKKFEFDEALVMKEPLLAASPVRSEQSPVSEKTEEKPEASENGKIAQPASSEQDEKVEKAEMPEKSFPAAQNMTGEKMASEPAEIKKSEKKPDISTEKAPSATDIKTAVSSNVKTPVTVKKDESERKVTAQMVLPQAGTGQNGQQDLPQKAESRPPLPLPAAPESRKEVTAPSGAKEITSPKLPDIRVSPGPNLSVSEEKPLQDISAASLSPEMTLPAIEEEAASPVSEKVETTSPPALQTAKTEKIENPKADMAMTKKDAETAVKIEQPKAITPPSEARAKKKGKSGEVVEDLPGKEPSLLKGDGKTPAAKNRNSGVRATRTSSPPGSSGSEGKPGHEKTAGVDKTVVSVPKQTIQKPGESGGSLNDLLKQAHGSLADSVEIGAKKPDMGLKADSEKNVSPIRLGGSGTDKNHAALHLAGKFLGQLASALEGSAESPAAGTELKPTATHAAVEGPENAGGPVTKFDSDTTSQAQPVEGQTTRSESAAPPDPGKETEKNRIGIPVSEALIQKDIKIEVVLESADTPDVLTQLFRKSHPKLRGRRDREKQETVEGIAATRASEGTGTIGTRLFSVAKAEKGVYTFVLENKGTKARAVDVIFRFYEGRDNERGKEYKSREILPGGLLRFVFIMPEAFFWDDEDRFSGSVEDSRSITKFDSESGLVWKEEKERGFSEQNKGLEEQSHP